MRKSIPMTVLLMIFFSTHAEAGNKSSKIDATLLTVGAISGYYGTKLLLSARSDTRAVIQEKNVLLYNRDLDNVTWIQRFDQRELDKEAIDQKLIYGAGLMSLSGLTFYVWYKWRFDSVQPRTNDLGLTLTLNF